LEAVFGCRVWVSWERIRTFWRERVHLGKERMLRMDEGHTATLDEVLAQTEQVILRVGLTFS